MTSFKRLILIGTLATEQAKATNQLMDSEGVCTCGRFLKRTDAKLCLGQINTADFADPRMRNTLVIAAYCYDCASRINDLLKYLKDTKATPEPDRTRHEIGG